MHQRLTVLLLLALFLPSNSTAGETCDFWKGLSESERESFLREQANQELRVFLAADALAGLDTACFRDGYPESLRPVWVVYCEKLEWSDYLLGRSVQGAVDLLVGKCPTK